MGIYELFELSNSEFYCTSIVKHQINTEGHPPIKQMPKRIRITSLRENVSKYIQEMMDQSINVPFHNLWVSPVALAEGLAL